MNTKKRTFIFIAVMLCTSLLSLGQTRAWENPINHVSDFANIIAPDNESRINALAKKLKEVSQDELAVVTIQNYKDRRFGSIEETAVDLFESWGIGKKGEDNGLLVLVTVDERQWRIEVGYGLEGYITDAAASSMGRNILTQHFRARNFGKGLEDLSIALVATIAEQKNIPLSQFQINEQPRPQQNAPSQGRRAGGLLESIGSIFFGLFMMYMFIKHPRLFILLMMMNQGGGRNNHWSGGSHFGGGFGGGGFGGFGGGRSGGGGASGGW